MPGDGSIDNLVGLLGEPEEIVIVKEVLESVLIEVIGVYIENGIMEDIGEILLWDIIELYIFEALVFHDFFFPEYI